MTANTTIVRITAGAWVPLQPYGREVLRDYMAHRRTWRRMPPLALQPYGREV